MKRKNTTTILCTTLMVTSAFTPMVARMSQPTNVDALESGGVDCDASIGVSFSYADGQKAQVLGNVNGFGLTGYKQTEFNGMSQMAGGLSVNAKLLQKNPQALGNFGMMYPGVGKTSDGKQVNLKAIVTGVHVNNPAEGEASFMLSDAVLGIQTKNCTVEQQFIPVDEDGNPIKEDVTITFSDIDIGQTLGIVSDSTGSISKGPGLTQSSTSNLTLIHGGSNVEMGDANGSATIQFNGEDGMKTVWGGYSGNDFEAAHRNATQANIDLPTANFNIGGGLGGYLQKLRNMGMGSIAQAMDYAANHNGRGGWGAFVDMNSNECKGAPSEQKERPGTATKKVDKERIYKQGETITYTLSGKLPKYNWKKHVDHSKKVDRGHYVTVWETNHDDDFWVKDDSYYNGGYWNHKYDYDESHQEWRSNWTHSDKPGNLYLGWHQLGEDDAKKDTGDNFTVTDQLPSSVSLISASASGIKLVQQGQTIKAVANQEDLVNANGGSWSITIKVKADRLPQPNNGGNSTKGSLDGGGFTDEFGNSSDFVIKNKADYSSTIGGKVTKTTTPEVKTKIQRVTGTVHHYDHDKEEKGNFDFMSQKPNGKNYQYKGHYTSSFKEGKVYGYINDKKTSVVLKDEKKPGGNWRYRFAYNEEANDVTLLLGKEGQEKYVVPGGKMDFYLPYIVPRVKIVPGALSVDTDAAENGLPFKLALRGEAFLYTEYDKDYPGGITFNIKADGKTVGTVTKSFKELLPGSATPHGKHWTLVQGKLDTSSFTGSGNWGKQLDIEMTSDPEGNNPGQIQIDTAKSVHSKAHIANRGTVTFDKNGSENGFDASSKNFGRNNNPELKVNVNGNNETVVSPERTVKYMTSDGLGNPKEVSGVRTLHEKLSVTQPRKVFGKTGYGMSEKLKVEYQGALRPNSYTTSTENSNYSFPLAFNQANSNIAYHKDPLHKGDSSQGKYDYLDVTGPSRANGRHSLTATGFSHDGESIANPTSKLEEDNLLTPLVDRLRSDVSTNGSYDGDLDSDEGLKSSAWQDGDNLSSVQNAFEDEAKGSFTNKLSFFTRFADHNNGNLTIKSDELSSDKHAKNNKSKGSDAMDGGQRFFTPYWMELGKYDTFFSTEYQSADKDETNSNFRFGGNWFNIDENRPVGFFAHMYLDKGTKTEASDELAIQPILSDKQAPKSDSHFTANDFKNGKGNGNNHTKNDQKDLNDGWKSIR